MTKDLQKQIEELEEIIRQVPAIQVTIPRELAAFECYLNSMPKAISIIKQLQEEITQLRKLSGWRSKDILPEKEITHGILFDGGVPFQAWLVQGIWCRMPKNTVLEHVTDFTYWKPLDLPPHLIKGENNDK